MKMNIVYSAEIPSAEQIYKLYDCFGWNNVLKMTKESIQQAMIQSWYVASAFHQNKLVGTGRIVSDGLINAYLCGLVVHPSYQNKGIGSEIVRRLVTKGHSNNLHIELFCEDEYIHYYEKFGFEVFASGMKYRK
jgi:N-acetylglutamate synthase-like GNAT family acetyltransferase